MVVNTMKYALLIREVCYKNGDDVSDMSDDDVIYYYENTSWGNYHSIGLATKQVFEAFMRECVKPHIKRYKSFIDGGGYEWSI